MNIIAVTAALILFLVSAIFPQPSLPQPIKVTHAAFVIQPINSMESRFTVTLDGRTSRQTIKGSLETYDSSVQGKDKMWYLRMSGSLLPQIVRLNRFKMLPESLEALHSYIDNEQIYIYTKAGKSDTSTCKIIYPQTPSESDADDESLKLTAPVPFNAVIYTSFGSTFDTSLTGILVGAERVNGVDTLHYVLDKATIARLAQRIDRPVVDRKLKPWRKVKMLSGEIWVEAKQHYLVKMRETGRGVIQDLLMAAPFTGNFEATYEILSINRPLTITLPAACQR